MGKLVRNRIPEIIRAEGRAPLVRVLNGEEYAAALRTKLEEEVQELLAADPSEVLDEAADVLEVVLTMLRELGQTQDDLLKAAEAKRSTPGGFGQRFWLED